MSRQYFKQIQALKGNNYTTAYAALMSYCVGKGTFFNPKRRAILEALNHVHPNADPSYVINNVVNTLDALGSSIFDIKPTSKLAAVFYVINENEKNLDKTTTQISVQNIIKLDEARKEETVVKLLKRYSALWIVRLFTGELGNKHVKEIRALLKQYQTKQFSYEDLMTAVTEINTKEKDPLQELKPFIATIEHKASNENHEDEDNQSISTHDSEKPKENSENEKITSSSSSQKKNSYEEPQLDQASIDAHKRVLEKIKTKIKNLVDDIDYLSKHKNTKLLDIFWGANSASKLLEECNALKSQLEECLELTPAKYYENAVGYIKLIDSDHQTYVKISYFREQYEIFSVFCKKTNQDLEILLQTLVSYFDLFDLDCKAQIDQSIKQYYQNLKKQYLKKFNEFQENEMTAYDDDTERKVFHREMTNLFMQKFVLSEWKDFPQLNQHFKKVRNLASQIMENIRDSSITDEIHPLFKECKTELEVITILNSQAHKNGALFKDDTQFSHKYGISKSAQQSEVCHLEEQHQKELLQKRDVLLAERTEERRKEAERLRLDEMNREKEKLEKEARHREEEAKQRQMLLAEKEALLKKEEEQRKLEQILQQKQAEELRTKEEAKRNEEKRAREEKERIELAELQEKKSKMIKEKKELLKEVLIQCLTYLSMSQKQLGISEADYNKQLTTKKTVESSEKAILALEEESEIDANTTRLKKLLYKLDEAYSKHRANLDQRRILLQSMQNEIQQYTTFYSHHNFNHQLPVCKLLDFANIQQSLITCLTTIKNLLVLSDDQFHDAVEKGVDFSKVIASHKAFVTQYQKELKEEPARQKSLQTINERVKKTHEKLAELSSLLDTPLDYLKITEEELKKKKQACRDLLETTKKFNPESIQDHSINDLKKLEEEISQLDTLIKNIGLDTLGRDLRANCQSVVSEIKNKINALSSLVEGEKHYSSQNCLREDVSKLSYHQSKKISALDVKKLLEDTEKLRKETAVLIESFKLLPNQLAFENIGALADVETIIDRINAQHDLNKQFLNECNKFMEDYAQKNYQLERTFRFVDSFFQLLPFENSASKGVIDQVMNTFVGIKNKYSDLKNIRPNSHDELDIIDSTIKDLLAQYFSLLRNADFPELKEHIECVYNIAKKLAEDTDNIYFIRPLFNDCSTNWDMSVKLNNFAEEARILFRKDMDILGGGFFGPYDPPLNMNINYVEDNSIEKAEEASRKRQIEEDRRRQEEQRRREEELRMIILISMKQVVLDTVKRSQDSWNIDYTDTQLEEKIDALFTRRNFAKESVVNIANTVIENLNQVHQKVVHYEVYYNY